MDWTVDDTDVAFHLGLIGSWGFSEPKIKVEPIDPAFDNPEHLITISLYDEYLQAQSTQCRAGAWWWVRELVETSVICW